MRILLIALICYSTLSFGQDNAPAQTKQLSAGQILSLHYARSYQAALRYNDYGAAKNALYNLIVENPQNDSLLYSLSLLYFQTQNFTSAALTAQDVITLNPENLSAIEIAAVAFDNIGAKDKALEQYETLYLKSDDFQTLYKMAFLQYDMKRYAESKTNADILMGRKEAAEGTASFNDKDGNPVEFPIKVALLNLKGLIAQAQGDKKAAESFYNQALAISPEFQMARDNLSSLKK